MIEVSIQEAKELRKLGFTWSKIATMLNISRRTLYRCLEDTDLAGYSDVSDQELDGIIQTYKRTHPNDGEAIVMGYIRSQGIHVPRRRIRESLHRVDPAGIEERRLTTIRRREYHVDAPNDVWHMDGHHKLIRWKFVIHGAIDGYSRLIVFLKCSTNNKSGTVFPNEPFLCKYCPLLSGHCNSTAQFCI